MGNRRVGFGGGFELVIVAGPTASGKTALALELAERGGCEILSCDAYCVYRGMDIGTAKPTGRERCRVVHHGLDVAAVDVAYSVGAYLELAKRVVKEAEAEDRPLVVAGGSGFYLKGFFEPVVDRIAIAPEVASRVAALEAEGLETLLAELDRHNPSGTGELDRHNPRRVSNALKRCLASGRSLVELQASFRAERSAFEGMPRRVVLIDREDWELKERIGMRTDAMLKEGLIEEVEELCAEGLESNPAARTAIGYREVLAWMRRGRDDTGELAAAIKENTWRLVKKQRKWFRRQIPVDTVLDATGKPAALLAAALAQAPDSGSSGEDGSILA